MFPSGKDTLCSIEEAKLKYNEYASSQKCFEYPQSHINIEREFDETTKVHIEVKYKGTEYYFQSIEEKHLNDIYFYLNSQKVVRAKYADGNLMSLEGTISRIKTFVKRFEDKDSPLYLYSGFVVSDAQTETFLGVANLGAGPDMGSSEMAILNRSECWSHPPEFISIYSSNNFKNLNKKLYSGIGTVEICTLIQYATKLKELNYKVNGHELQSVVAMSRIDNPGSWKSAAKAQMILDDVDVIPRYGPHLRYQLRKFI